MFDLPTGTSMRKNPLTRWVLPLIVGIAVMGLSAFSAAQEPGSAGQTDPVGPPASYIILRNDNLAISNLSGANDVLDTYQADLGTTDASLGSLLTSNTVPSAGVGSSVSVAGRILSQDKDQLAIVERSGSLPNSIKVRFALGGDFALSDLHDRLDNAPDQITAAVGDLDKLPDASGMNHDEMVVAYAGKNGEVNVAVLNYTASQANASKPIYVTQAVAPFKVNLNPTLASPINGDQQGFKLSEVLAVAIGDFDGDGQNEVALATLDPALPDQVNLTTFRYVHPTLSATPALTVITTKSFSDLAGGGRSLLPTISLAAGDFQGTGKAQLVLGLRTWVYDSQNPSGAQWDFNLRLQTITFDGNLNPTLFGEGIGNAAACFSAPNDCPGDLHVDSIPQERIPALRILCLSGLTNYDASNGFNLYRRELAVVWNNSTPAEQGDFDFLNISTYTGDKVFDLAPLGNPIFILNHGVFASYAATLGAFGVDGNINNPVWSLAVETVQTPPAVTPPESKPNQETVYLFPTINGQGLTYGKDRTEATPVHSFDSACVTSLCDSTTQNAFRPTIQAYDHEGRTVLLGAPIKIVVPKVISTDFVLQDPPKQTYWDETKGNLVVVSRVPGIATSLKNQKGVTYSAMSTDTSASSVGGSEAATASASISSDVLGLFKINASTEVTSTATYNYDVNQSSYNSNYSSRDVTETESTVGDDFVSGREQDLTIWRYRVLGEAGQNSTGKAVNLYYDVVFPGPSVNFQGSGLDFDWYQPLQEPGNILSYPVPTNHAFSPLDIGTYDAPCPAGATDCKPNGTQAVTGPIFGSTEQFISGTSGSLTLDSTDTKGSGKLVGYEKKLGTSLDIKASFSAEVGFLGAQVGGSYALNTNSSNSWGNTTTSDATSTSETAITIARDAINSTQAYAIYPTFYTTLDGTIKVSYAADPLNDASGKSFWAGLYGALPDPALNLPLRFVLNGGQWAVNEMPTRKQMRGFFVLSETPDPVTAEYDILGQAPIDGQRVRLSAQVYNYSTAKAFTDCSVEFYAVKYDSTSDQEAKERKLIGSTRLSLQPRETKQAQIIWDTKGFGPAAGSTSQDYRIYVDLNSDKKIVEKYPVEDPKKTYSPGLPEGVDPGQNNEGFGSVTIMTSARAASGNSFGAPAVTFGSVPLAAATGTDSANSPVSTNPMVGEGMPVRLRAQICSAANSRDPVDLVVFDGEPSAGKVIAWKKVFAPGKGQCKGAWFDWAATRGAHNLVATIDPTAASSSIITQNAASLTASSPKRASLHVYVP